MRPSILMIACVLCATSSPAAPTLTGQAVIEQHCASCHAIASPMGSLDLRTREGMLRGGRRGPALIPGQADKSLIIQAVEGAGELKMPPGKKLPMEAVAALREWIDAGAPWQQKSDPDAVWAFQPLRKSSSPATVDIYISQKLRDPVLQPAPPAGNSTLIRTAPLALIGLPPT